MPTLRSKACRFCRAWSPVLLSVALLVAVIIHGVLMRSAILTLSAAVGNQTVAVINKAADIRELTLAVRAQTEQTRLNRAIIEEMRQTQINHYEAIRAGRKPPDPTP
jgi:hypothetical protein